jgi:hypothetical protein
VLSPEQLDNWFTYHAPTDETAPKYTAIRNAELSAHRSMVQARFENVGRFPGHDLINRETRNFAVVIDLHAPDGDDKAAAIRSVRLARNLYNEWWAQTYTDPKVRDWNDPNDLLLAAALEMAKARMQANTAIACGGK